MAPDDSPPSLTPEERALRGTLLRMGRSDRPSDDARRRTLAAAVALAASTPTKAAATGAVLRLLSLGKWLGAGAIVIAGSALTVRALRPAPAVDPAAAVSGATPGPGPAPVAASRAASDAVEPAQDSPPAGSEAPPAGAASAGEGREGRSAPPAVAGPGAPREAASARPSLGEEMAVIDGARRALGSGDAQAALAALDAYQKQFPSGRFGQEAAFLRIEALTRRGQKAAAAALARRFLATYKKSPLAPRVRLMTGLGDEHP